MICKRMTCILCPNGCELEARYTAAPSPESILVEGNLCPKGIDYAVEELTDPKRTLTTSVLVRHGVQPQTSVKTATPVPRDALMAARRALLQLSLDAPVAIGDIVSASIAETGVAVVVTRAVARRS